MKKFFGCLLVIVTLFTSPVWAQEKSEEKPWTEVPIFLIWRADGDQRGVRGNEKFPLPWISSIAIKQRLTEDGSHRLFFLFDPVAAKPVLMGWYGYEANGTKLQIGKLRAPWGWEHGLAPDAFLTTRRPAIYADSPFEDVGIRLEQKLGQVTLRGALLTDLDRDGGPKLRAAGYGIVGADWRPVENLLLGGSTRSDGAVEGHVVYQGDVTLALEIVDSAIGTRHYEFVGVPVSEGARVVLMHEGLPVGSQWTVGGQIDNVLSERDELKLDLGFSTGGQVKPAVTYTVRF